MDQKFQLMMMEMPYLITFRLPPQEVIKYIISNISGDGGHTFDDTVKSITMTEESVTVEITNPEAPIRNFTLMDASFPNIPIIDGQIILENN